MRLLPEGSRRHAAVGIMMLLSACGFSPKAQAMPGWLGKQYCVLRHPVEAATSTSATCESQHVIQQNAGGGDTLNTIWINAAQHTYLDRSKGKPWEYERPYFEVGDENLERSYMIGTWAMGFNFVIYDHHGNGRLTLFEWDGATHLLYAWAVIANLPQKEVGYFASQMRQYRLYASGYVRSEAQMADALLGILVDIVEVAIGVIYSLIGIVVGTIMNPIDTILNLFGVVVLLLTTTVEAVLGLAINIWSIVSFGGERA